MFNRFSRLKALERRKQKKKMSSNLVPFGKLSAPSPDPDADDNSSKRQATRVFKKSSSNGKITVYLGKRDFVDHITHVDPIGKIFVCSNNLRNRLLNFFVFVCRSIRCFH